NVMLISADRVVTPPADGSILQGVTRESLLTLASDRGMTVEERTVTVDELLAWCEAGEVALAGTAAVLAPVGTLIVDGAEITVGDGQAGPHTLELREALIETQVGKAEDVHGWTLPLS